METIPTNKGPMNFSDLIADLTYTSYAVNRAAAPNITPQSWKKVYGPEVDLMEAKYQAELAIRKAKVKPVCPKCGEELSCHHYDSTQTSAGCETFVPYCNNCDWEGEPS